MIEVKWPYEPWDHQRILFDALENKGYKRIIATCHRRSGKDVAAFNATIRWAAKHVGSYAYMLPKFSQARVVIWQCILNNSKKMLDFIPSEIIRKKSEQSMRIEFINGSQIILCGSDSYNSLMGINLKGIVFSEAALMDERAWSYFSPILTMNNGWAIFQSTPRGSNYYHKLWSIAQDNPDVWFSYLQTILDTKLIDPKEIDALIERGEISWEHAQQEYYCSFSSGVDSTYYGKYIDKMRFENRIGDFVYQNNLPVYTSCDLGWRDQMVFIFYQLVNNSVHIIDCYASSGEGIEHYVAMLNKKGYIYAKQNAHIAPHDIRVHELSTGNTRWSKFHSLGITMDICVNTSVENGIEAVRTLLPRVCINEKAGNCPDLINALEIYRPERVSTEGASIPKPVHDKASNYCDALRYFALMLPTLKQDGLTPDRLQKLRHEAKWGSGNTNPFWR